MPKSARLGVLSQPHESRKNAGKHQGAVDDWGGPTGFFVLFFLFFTAILTLATLSGSSR